MTTNSTSVQTAVKLVTASHKAYTQKWAFLGLFVFVLFISTSAAAIFDVLPDPAKTVADETSAPLVLAPVTAVATPELPTKIEIPAISLSQKIANPNTTDVQLLDNALLAGPVRYPTSAELGVNGNVIIFGHSSYLPIVNNQAFKAFDGIQKLKQGDRITVTGATHVFVYSVETVEKKSAATDDSIPLSVEGSKLTLATCNSFGTHSDRFVVTATLVETDVLVNTVQ
ncbi:MAG: Peptidase sortase-like protein [Parcubacteria group bacterium]|nr:Peptidase sortase-like protein [Parcubacteria group bacterium]